MSTDPFYKGPSAAKVRRRLDEVPLSERPDDDSSQSKVVDEKNVQKLFDGFAFQINRATALLRELEPRVKKMFVPVDVNAVAVRAAVRRRLQGNDGTQIPFDLYKDMIDQRVDSARKLSYEIAGELTGDVLSDTVVIKKYMKSGGKGLSSWEEFLLNAEPFLLWMIFTQLQGQFTCVEHQEVTIAKQPPGTEFGPTMLRHSIAVAAMMLIMGMQEDHVMFAVRQPAGNLGIPPGELLQKARRLIKTDLHREVNELVGASDPQLIIDYCDNYAGSHPTEYTDWLAYRDLRNVREQAKTIYVYGHHYSEGTRTLLDASYESVHRQPLPAGGGFLGMGGRRATVESVENSVLPMSPEQYVGSVNAMAGIDRSISSIAGVITSGWEMDLLCCFGRFMGKEDVKRLRKIRGILKIAQSGVTTGIRIPDPVNVLDMALAAIQQQMLVFVQQAFQKFGRDFVGWVSKRDGKTWEALFACPLIEDLLVFALDQVGVLRDKVYELIRRFMGQNFQLNTNVYTRWGTIYDARRLSTIVSILDRLIAQVEICARVEDGDGIPTFSDPADDPTIYDAVPKPLKLPPQVVDKFFANDNPVGRGPKQRAIPPVNTSLSSTDQVVSNQNFRSICRGILPDELIEAITRQSDGP